MNPDTLQIIELPDPDTLDRRYMEPLPPGFLELPEELQPAAAQLTTWAKAQREQRQAPTSTPASRAKRKQERQNRRRGRSARR